MHGEPRVRRNLPGPGLIAKARVVVALLTIAGDENERKALGRVLANALAARRDVGRERIEAGLFHDRGVELDLAGRRRERPRRPRPGGHLVVAYALQVCEGKPRVAEQIGVELALRAPGQQMAIDGLTLPHLLEQGQSSSERASPLGGTRARVKSTVGPDGMN